MAVARELNLLRFFKIRTVCGKKNKMKLIEDSQLASYFVLFNDHSDIQRFSLAECVILYIVIFQED